MNLVHRHSPIFACVIALSSFACSPHSEHAGDDAGGPPGDAAMPGTGDDMASSDLAGLPDMTPPPNLPDVTKYVDPIIGTDSAGISNAVGGGNGGSVFPGAVVPWGMVQFSPDTPKGEPSGYAYGDKAITGFSLTHFSGAGCPNNGDLPILALPAADKTFAFEHAKEHASPGYYDVTSDDGVRVELTATLRTGLARFTFPKTGGAVVTFDAGRSQTVSPITTYQVTANGQTGLSGYSMGGKFCGGPTFPIYFEVQFDRAWTAQTIVNGKATLTFDPSTTPVVKMKIGISYFSQANAKLNLDTENSGFDFDAAAAKAKQDWNTRLNAVQISGGSDADKTKFYTALYHTLLHPNVYSDVNGDYIGFEKVNHKTDSGHVLYANFSGWDIYRSEIQLVALLFPDIASDIVQSLVLDAQQCGAFPKWSQNNVEDDVMAGDPGSLIVANAYAFGAKSFDTMGALAIMRNMSFNPGAACNGAVELPALDSYGGLGYSPGPTWSASDTLEYAVRDAAVSQFADAVGDADLARALRARAASWQNGLNANKLIEPRNQDGSWATPLLGPAEGFNGGYVEGNAEQYTWFVPHDPRTLFDVLGGNAAVVTRLDAFFTNINAGGKDPYCYIGNEPSFTAPFLYDWAGAPAHAQQVVRRAIKEVFSTMPGGLPGNDDLGATSSWLVWAMMGLYPELPGVGGLAIASPAFDTITINVGGGKSLRIATTGQPGPYIQSAKLNGSATTKLWLPIDTIRAGATLDFALGAAASSWGSAAADAPPSLGPGSFGNIGDASNNDGVSTDGANAASFDGYGWSYSAAEVAHTVTGGSFTFNDAQHGVAATFPFPGGPSALDNFITVGQTVTFATPQKARYIAILGSASAGPSTGTATPHYVEGDQGGDGKAITFSDWTLGGGGAAMDASNQQAIKTTYRNNQSGAHDNTVTYIFYTVLPLDAARTVKSVTLPAQVSRGRMHIFSLAVVP